MQQLSSEIDGLKVIQDSRPAHSVNINTRDSLETLTVLLEKATETRWKEFRIYCFFNLCAAIWRNSLKLNVEDLRSHCMIILRVWITLFIDVNVPSKFELESRLIKWPRQRIVDSSYLKHRILAVPLLFRTVMCVGHTFIQDSNLWFRAPRGILMKAYRLPFSEGEEERESRGRKKAELLCRESTSSHEHYEYVIIEEQAFCRPLAYHLCDSTLR